MSLERCYLAGMPFLYGGIGTPAGQRGCGLPGAPCINLVTGANRRYERDRAWVKPSAVGPVQTAGEVNSKPLSYLVNYHIQSIDYLTSQQTSALTGPFATRQDSFASADVNLAVFLGPCSSLG